MCAPDRYVFVPVGRCLCLVLGICPRIGLDVELLGLFILSGPRPSLFYFGSLFCGNIFIVVSVSFRESER